MFGPPGAAVVGLEETLSAGGVPRREYCEEPTSRRRQRVRRRAPWRCAPPRCQRPRRRDHRGLLPGRPGDRPGLGADPARPRDVNRVTGGLDRATLVVAGVATLGLI